LEIEREIAVRCRCFGCRRGSSSWSTTIVADPDDEIPALSLEFRPDLPQSAELSGQDRCRYRALTHTVPRSTEVLGSLKEHRHRWHASLPGCLTVAMAAGGIKSEGVDYRRKAAAHSRRDDPVEDVESDLAGVEVMLTASSQSPQSIGGDDLLRSIALLRPTRFA
jgi:hypothetical protein